jgi:hypothetical protein
LGQREDCAKQRWKANGVGLEARATGWSVRAAGGGEWGCPSAWSGGGGGGKSVGLVGRTREIGSCAREQQRRTARAQALRPYADGRRRHPRAGSWELDKLSLSNSHLSFANDAKLRPCHPSFPGPAGQGVFGSRRHSVALQRRRRFAESPPAPAVASAGPPKTPIRQQRLEACATGCELRRWRM